MNQWSHGPEPRLAKIDAKPAPLTVDPVMTAVIVVDMQNAFGSEGGAFDRAGIDITNIQSAIGPTSKVVATARAAGIKIIYLKMGFRSDLSDAGAPDSPNWLRHLPLGGIGEPMRSPDGTEHRNLIRDSWSTDIVPELSPQADDIVIYKHRYSGFYQTELDAILKELNIKHLIVTGCTTSVCVESTVRDATFRDYACVLLEDCMAEPVGHGLPRSNHEASLLVIQTLFGWVSDSHEFTRALEIQLVPSA